MCHVLICTIRFASIALLSFGFAGFRMGFANVSAHRMKAAVCDATDRTCSGLPGYECDGRQTSARVGHDEMLKAASI